MESTLEIFQIKQIGKEILTIKEKPGTWWENEKDASRV